VAAVGATGELIEDGVDGALLGSSDDWALTSELATVLQQLSTNREDLARLSSGAAARAASVSWQTNVAPLVKQLELWFPKRWNADAQSPSKASVN
jgi:hypothetical protein